MWEKKACQELAERMSEMYNVGETLFRVVPSRKSEPCCVDLFDSETSSDFCRLTLTPVDLNGMRNVLYTDSAISDFLYKRFYKHLDYKHIAKQSGGIRPFFRICLDGFWIKQLFNITVVNSNAKDTRRVVKFTDLRTGKELEVCLAWRDFCNGWMAADPSTKDFMKLRGVVPSITEIMIMNSTNFTKPIVDHVRGILTLSDGLRHKDGFSHLTRVTSQARTIVKVEYLQIDFPKNKPYSRHDSSSTRTNYTFTLKDGKIKIKKEALPMPEWLDAVYSDKDLFKNPRNVPAHPFLPKSDTPIFEGHRLFITSTRQVYIQSGDMWILVQAEWLLEHLPTMPEIQREWLAVQMMDLNLSGLH